MSIGQQKVYVIGSEQSDFSLYDYLGPEVLMTQVIRGLIEDSRIDPAWVTEIFPAFVGSAFTGQEILLGRVTGAYDVWKKGMGGATIENACASGGSAFWLAALIAANSRIPKCIIPIGYLEMHTPRTFDPGKGRTDMKIVGNFLCSCANEQRLAEGGLQFPRLFAKTGGAGVKLYGELFAQAMFQVSSKNRKHATLNPLAQLRNGSDQPKNREKELANMFEQLGSDFFLRSWDCCGVTNGASAVMVVNEAFLAEHPELVINPMVEIGGVVNKVQYLDTYEAGDLLKPEILIRLVQELDEMSEFNGVPDGAEVHDCFTPAEIIMTWALMKKGMAEVLTDIVDGQTALGGSMPINPSGGRIGNGHPVPGTGPVQIREAYLQLKGLAGQRQIPKCRTFRTVNMGSQMAAWMLAHFKQVTL